MIAALLLSLLVAWAEPGPEVVRQQLAVEAAAEAVARARATGARRAEIAELMKVYREAAEALEALRAPDSDRLEDERRERREAVGDLAEAIAEGRSDKRADAVLTAWLGPLPDRLDALRTAVDAIDAVPTELQAAVWADVAEQAAALSVKLTYDGLDALARAERYELQAMALRRQGPGSAATLGTEVDAQRLETQAAAARAEHAALQTLRGPLDDLRQRTPAPMETP